MMIPKFWRQRWRKLHIEHTGKTRHFLSPLIAQGNAIGTRPLGRGRNAPKVRVESSESMLKAIASMPLGSALEHLDSDIDGLTISEAASRLKIFGPNELTSTKPPSWWKLLLTILPNSFNVLLALLAIISVVTPTRSWVCCRPPFGSCG
jgi:magnesium-transporting ATPase (P-type)